MNKILVVLFLLLASPCFAAVTPTTTTPIPLSSVNNYESLNEIGVKVDAPDLVIVNDYVSIGVEGSKDLNMTDVNEGWKTYGKVTIKWTALDLRK